MFDRDEQEISQIIENGLEAILSGGATLESVVAQHPEQAEIIRPELEGALWLVSQRQEVEPRPGFVKASRRRVVERIKAEAKSQGAKHAFLGFAWPQRPAFQWVVGAAVILFLLLGAGGMLTISQNALPGDGLYTVKRFSEQVSYSVTLNEVQKVQLSAQFAERRITEVETLLDRKDYPSVTATLSEYEKQVNQTVELLKGISSYNTEQKLGAAFALRADLVDNTERIENLLVSAPAIVRAELEQARDLTKFNAVVTNSVIDDLPPITGTTAEPFGTPTPSIVVYPSDTVVPSGTPQVEQTPVGGGTSTITPVRPTETVTPGNPTGTKTLSPADIDKTKKPTKTPKPPPDAKDDNNSDNENSNKDKDKDKKDPPGKNK